MALGPVCLSPGDYGATPSRLHGWSEQGGGQPLAVVGGERVVTAEHIEQVEHALSRLLGGLTLVLHHREQQFQGIGGSPHGG